MYDSTDTLMSSTYYVPFAEMDVDSLGRKTSRSFIGSNLMITTSNGKSTYLGIIRDHVGSVLKVVNLATKVVLQERSYTAFGEERDPVTWIPYTHASSRSHSESHIQTGVTRSLSNGNATEGTDLENTFGNHQTTLAPSLLHTSGRLYSPLLCRFVSADLYGQGLGSSQGLNKYSFVANRPLSDADPTGYSHHDSHSNHHFWRHFALRVIHRAADAALDVLCGGPECSALLEAAITITKDKIEGDSWGMAFKDGAISFLKYLVPKEVRVGFRVTRIVVSDIVKEVTGSGESPSFSAASVAGIVSFSFYNNPMTKVSLSPHSLMFIFCLTEFSLFL